MLLGIQRIKISVECVYAYILCATRQSTLLNSFLKVARVGGQTWDVFDFRLFSLKIAVP